MTVHSLSSAGVHKNFHDARGARACVIIWINFVHTDWVQFLGTVADCKALEVAVSGTSTATRAVPVRAGLAAQPRHSCPR